MNEFVLPGLVKRRAELAGDLTKALARVQQLYADLTSMDAVIHQFDPDYRVDAIQTRHRRDPIGDEFAAIGRTALGILRKAGEPIATTEIAERIAVERGLDVGVRAIRGGMVSGVGRALRHQRGGAWCGPLRKVGKSVLWALAE